MHERGLALPGDTARPSGARAAGPRSRSTSCPVRTSTWSASDPSLFVRFPLKGRDAESLVVWTTTPWTLPANVAAAVNPDAEYGKRDTGEWVAVARYPDEEFVERVPGSELVGLEYEGPFDHLPAAAGVEHRVIPWDDVVARRGHRDRPHRAGLRRRGLRAREGSTASRSSSPVDESGRFYAGLRLAARQLDRRGRRPDRRRPPRARPARARDNDRPPLPALLALRGRRSSSASSTTGSSRSTSCGRSCSTRTRAVEWTPDFFGKRMDDWLRNMGDWNISRKRYFGLPLPFYPCACGHLTVIGSKAELEERATCAGSTSSRSCTGRGSTRCVIRCEACGEEVRPHPRGRRRLARRGHRPVLDARLAERRPGSTAATRRAPPRA